MTTSKDNWDAFVAAGAEYMTFANNRQPGVSPSGSEVTALASWQTAYTYLLTSDQKAQYAAMGGPNVILRHAQSIGGFRNTPPG
jgi:hypothetical protein